MSPTSNLILRFTRAGGQWQSIPVPEGSLLIGRKSDCNLQLRGGMVSRRHAEIRRRGDRVWILDLGSSNGTEVNGKTLVKDIPQPLLPGQRVTIGDYSLVLQAAATPSGIPPKPSTYRQRGGYIFISYSRRNRNLVYPLAQKLKSSGFKTWIDTQDIKPGNPWKGQIVQGIAEADAFVLLLTPDSAASENVRKELDLALDADVLVLPVILQPAKIPNAMKYQLVGIQRINLFEHPETGYSQIVDSIQERQEFLAQHPPVRPKELQAELYLPGANVSDFYPEKQQNLINFLAQVVNVSPRSMSIASIAPGSIRVIVTMPAAAAYELKAQAFNGNPLLLQAGISALRLVGDKQFIQVGGAAPPGVSGPGQPPGSPPGSPPATTLGGGGLKMFLWMAGAAILIMMVIYTISRIEIVGPPVTRVPPATLVHTDTPVPTSTFTPTATRTKTLTPSEIPTSTSTRTLRPTVTSSATWTPTPSPTNTEYVCAPHLTLGEVGASCYAGPGTVYDPITYFEYGDTLQIDGQNEHPSIKWWWIQIPNSADHCWISDELVSTSGDLSCLDVIPAPPTPTPTPTTPPPPEPFVCVDFEPPIELGTQYGTPVGDEPGDHAFTTNNIPVHLYNFVFTNGGGTFNFATVDSAMSSPPFGTGQTMGINNINLEFDFSGIGFQTSEVTVDFLDYGGFENLEVNGSPYPPPYVGELSSAPDQIGGVSVTVSTISDYGGEMGVLTLTGSVQTLRIGGQEFWIDNVCAWRSRYSQ
jgi:hypothetical protein